MTYAASRLSIIKLLIELQCRTFRSQDLRRVEKQPIQRSPCAFTREGGFEDRKSKKRSAYWAASIRATAQRTTQETPARTQTEPVALSICTIRAARLNRRVGG